MTGMDQGAGPACQVLFFCAIQQELENPLAQDILAARVGPDDTVMADVKDRRIVFSVIAEAK